MSEQEWSGEQACEKMERGARAKEQERSGEQTNVAAQISLSQRLCYSNFVMLCKVPFYQMSIVNQNSNSVHFFTLLLETLEWAKHLVSRAVSGCERNWLERERVVAEQGGGVTEIG